MHKNTQLKTPSEKALNYWRLAFQYLELSKKCVTTNP